MEKQELHDLRRQRLREWLALHHGGKVSPFASAYGLKQPVLADVLDGRKSFGDKFAAKIESIVPGMPEGYLIYPRPTLRDRLVMQAYQRASTGDRSAAERVLGLYDLPDSPLTVTDDNAKKSHAPKGLAKKAPSQKQIRSGF